ncbi:uncharacterized protein LOC123553997 [Mercenaria mercenaria]|uniref:uncharacterized protein LOC123553997 n=1 Tax=Mercenaria mercenaria TaxID=6596 RepID=UPI00234EEA1C|nr:uncharacterized protein LOC123553997 [Mercenaria mercenaria]
MDVCKFISCLLCLVVCGLPDFTDAQLGGYAYPRRIRPRGRLYPVYPRDPYRRPIYHDPVLPIGGGRVRGVYPPVIDGGLRRPTVVTDRSERQRSNINVQNTNNNRRIESSSGNVNVNQVQETGQTRCVPACDSLCYGECVHDSSCTGGRCSPIIGGGMFI